MAVLYLAIDITKEGGRHILGCLDKGKLKLEEVYSFDVSYTERDGKNLWDLQEIFRQIKAGIAYCRGIGKLPVLVGLTACDGYFVLLDNDDRVIDDRVFSLDDALAGDLAESYASCALRAKTFLMLSDYFNFLLTGRKQCEYTGLLREGLLSMETGDLNEENIKKLCLSKEHFPLVLRPGNVISNLTLEVTEEVGYDFVIIQAASQKACVALAKIPDIYSDVLGDDIKEDVKSSEGRPDDEGSIVSKEVDSKAEAGKEEEDTENKGNDGDINEEDRIRNENIDEDSQKDNGKPAGDGWKREKKEPTDKVVADELKAAIGCLCILMITSHEFRDFDAARECIMNTLTK